LLQTSLWQGQPLVDADLLIYSYPRCGLIGESLARGELPRWNPWVYHGASWFGPRAGGVLYPGNALFAVFPLVQAMASFVLLHLLLGVVGAQALARRAGLGHRAAWAAGLCYGLGGFLTSMVGYLPFLISSAWLPWAAAAGMLVARRPRLGAAGLGASLALILLAAEPQGALAGALSGLLGATLSAPAGSRRGSATWACIGVGLGGVTAGLQVLSILVELPHISRALETFEDTRWQLSWGLLPELLAGGVLGDRAASLDEAYWGYSLWAGRPPWCGFSVGATGLVLVSAGIVAGRRMARRLGGAFLAAGFALAALQAGQGIGLRFPAKWLVIAALGLALLAGAGAQALLDGRARARAAALATVGLLIAVSVTSLLLARLPDAAAWFETQGTDLQHASGTHAQAAVTKALVRAAAAAALLGGLLLSRLPRRARGALLLGLLAGELTHLVAPSLRTVPAAALEVPPLVDVVKAASSGPVPPRLDSNDALTSGGPSPRPGTTPGAGAWLTSAESWPSRPSGRWSWRGSASSWRRDRRYGWPNGRRSSTPRCCWPPRTCSPGSPRPSAQSSRSWPATSSSDPRGSSCARCDTPNGPIWRLTWSPSTTSTRRGGAPQRPIENPGRTWWWGLKAPSSRPSCRPRPRGASRWTRSSPSVWR
jgi:hypothetical protein